VPAIAAAFPDDPGSLIPNSQKIGKVSYPWFKIDELQVICFQYRGWESNPHAPEGAQDFKTFLKPGKIVNKFSYCGLSTV
jgi:hypothetical protein